MSQQGLGTINDSLGGRHQHLKSIQIVDTPRVAARSKSKILSKILPKTKNPLVLKIVLKLQPPLQKDFDASSDANSLRWGCNAYIDRATKVDLEITRRGERRKPASVVTLELDFSSEDFGDEKTVTRKASGLNVTLTLGTAKTGLEIARLRADIAIKDIDSKGNFVEKLDHFVGCYDFVKRIGTSFAELHPAAKVAAAVVSLIFKKIDDISNSHKALGDIIRDMNSLLPTLESALERFLEENVREYLLRFVKLVVETAQKASTCYSHSSGDLVLRSFSRDEIARMEKEIRQLKENMELSTIVEMKGDVVAIRHVVGESQAGITSVEVAIGEARAAVTEIGRVLISEADEKLLDRLNPPQHCYYDPENCCLPGTRTTVLQALERWAYDTNYHSTRLYWLHGVAGSGKSSVATSICSALRKVECLSGSFFCKRDNPERRNPYRLIQSLAYFVARADKHFRASLLRVLRDEPAILSNGLRLQFQMLLEIPLSQVTQGDVRVPIILVIDALDECEDNKSVASFLAQIVALAPWLRLMVTSRPLGDISDSFSKPGSIIRRHNLFDEDAHDDILKYIQFQCSSEGTLDVLEDELTETQMRDLAKRSQGFFIWIDTVLKYVGKLAAKELDAIDDIINSEKASKPEEDLDVLYRVVLSSVSGEKEEMKKIVGCVIGLIFVTSRNEPLPAQALHAFIPREMGVLPKRTVKIIRELGSVLTEDSNSFAIRVCHTSFLDFIGDRRRSKDFWIDPDELDTMMAVACLDIMKADLKFNICHLESSYIPNSDEKDLKEKISLYISRPLQYSAMYWLDHISRSKPERLNTEILSELFCTEKALFWVEVMSLVDKLSDAGAILQNVPACLRNFPDISAVLEAASDLRLLVSSLYAPIAHSTPHIYVSALPWTPLSSTISNVQSSFFKRSQGILEHRIAHHSPILHILKTNSSVWTVAYSADGSRIVSGSSDDDVRIWDAHTGLPVGDPLQGHSDFVRAVGFSPDGSRIVSGSGDNTLRIWDAHTGSPVGEPLQDHSDSVSTVSYSPDGSRIVSGSHDYTLRIWDAHTGLPILGPLQSHQGIVHAVAYSPNGSRIVSGSGDKTLRIWDAHTGIPVGEPLRGHSDPVLAVAYSPDGNRIVSGSRDRTLLIWDAHTCLPIGEPLWSHSSFVSAVAYCPDGSRIVSGSYDKTLRIWDAYTGFPIGEPLQGHSEAVLSVAYSPDGSRIISGSRDRTLLIWDAHTGLSVGESPQGHSGIVNAVACCPDGSRIVSGSYDKTLRIWDAHTGLTVSEPLRGHSEAVLSVAYSPDGSRIVSGSFDKTLLIWDACTGLPVGESLQGHSKSVCAVAYCPDGSRIVSGSDDCTLRIWDAHTSLPIGEPLRGHSHCVLSVAYSPDGSRIVSGSFDETLRIWDAHTGLPVGKPLRGHSSLVSAVAYCPDGSRIVSGSNDITLRIWDAHTGFAVGEPLRGHSSSVLAVAYCPDGSRIVSGSYDSTLRIWDAHTGLPVDEHLRGHSKAVRAVGYSPDGSRIVSGSDDETLRIWDARTYLPVSEHLRGHSGSSIECRSDDGLSVYDTHTGPFVGKLRKGESRWDSIRQRFISISKSTPVTVSNAPDSDSLVWSTIPLCIPEDGWIRTLDGGLLLWIPPEFRDRVCDLSLFCMPVDDPRHPLKIRWNEICRGEGWTQVWNGVGDK